MNSVAGIFLYALQALTHWFHNNPEKRGYIIMQFVWELKAKLLWNLSILQLEGNPVRLSCRGSPRPIPLSTSSNGVFHTQIPRVQRLCPWWSWDPGDVEIHPHPSLVLFRMSRPLQSEARVNQELNWDVIVLETNSIFIFKTRKSCLSRTFLLGQGNLVRLWSLWYLRTWGAAFWELHLKDDGSEGKCGTVIGHMDTPGRCYMCLSKWEYELAALWP